LTATPRELENDCFRLEFDAAGRLMSVFDKRHNRELLAGTGNEWQLFEDRPGQYNAWDLLDRFEDHPVAKPAWDSVEVVERGPVSIAIRLRRKFSNSSAEQIIRLWAKLPRIDFETFVDWQETERILKVAFPVNVKAAHYETDTTAGVLERPNHRNTSWEQARFEVCCHKWVRLGEGGFGVSLLNDGKYGCDVRDNVMRLSLLRAPIRPDRTSDKGRHHFTYSLFTDAGDWRCGGLVEAAYDLNWPLRARPGKAKSTASLVQIDQPALHCQAVKLAEDGSRALILRLVELHGSHGSTQIRTQFAFSSIQFCDLLERPTEPVAVSDNVIRFSYRPYQLLTLRLSQPRDISWEH
jgi:alpha-mannosidase